MNSIHAGLSVYSPFALAVIQRRLAYKMSFFLRIFGGLVQVFILAALWDAIFTSSGSATLQGYDRASMLGYVVISWFVGQLVNTGMEWTVAMEIRQGQIAVNLVRPVSYFARLLAESWGNVVLNLVTVVLPGWVVLQCLLSFGMGQPLPAAERVLLFLPSVAMAFTLSFLVNFLFALSAFWLTYVFGFIMLKIALVRLFTGELIPLAFFPQGVGAVFEYLPFAGMNATPTGIWLGTYTGLDALRVLGVQAVWILVLLGLVRLAWSGALRRLTVSGG